MGKGKDESCNCDCKKEPTTENGLRYAEDYKSNVSLKSIDPSSFIHRAPSGLKYDADYHPIKTSKISDIVIKEMDYGYLVKVGCQTLCIETQTKLTTWLTEYIQYPQKVTKRWNDGYYHFAKAEETHIGVLAKSRDDFLKWSEQFPNKVRSKDYTKRFSVHVVDRNLDHSSIIYYCLSARNDCVGLALDKIIETNLARENLIFGKILEDSQICLKR